MKDENKNHNCSCENCGHCAWNHKNFFLRWLLGLIVLSMVFGLGLKIGEFKGILDGNYYPRMHRSYYGYGQAMMVDATYPIYGGYGYGPMMNWSTSTIKNISR